MVGELRNLTAAVFIAEKKVDMHATAWIMEPRLEILTNLLHEEIEPEATMPTLKH